MSEKRERCGGRAGEPNWRCESTAYTYSRHRKWHVWDVGCNIYPGCIKCPGCHDCSAKPAPTCAVHGKGVCEEDILLCFCPVMLRNNFSRPPHFLCGCAQEYGRVHTDTCRAWRWLSDCDDPYCPHYGIHQHAQEQGSGDAQGPGCESAPSSDPSPSALAMEAAEHMATDGLLAGFQSECVPEVTDRISRAISAAVKERDERIAELEGAHRWTEKDVDELQTKAFFRGIEEAQRAMNTAAQALKGKQ